MLETASEMVYRHLIECLPPGIPPSFLEIVSAHFVGSGRSRKACARLIMFDGTAASVEVFQVGKPLGFTCWGHRWTEMPGGACSWEGDRWVRCDADGNILPDQMTLPLEAA